MRYFGFVGEANEFKIDAYLNGAIALPALQHDMLAHAITGRLDEMAAPRPYSNEFMPVDYLDEYLQRYFRKDETGLTFIRNPTSLGFDEPSREVDLTERIERQPGNRRHDHICTVSPRPISMMRSAIPRRVISFLNSLNGEAKTP